MLFNKQKTFDKYFVMIDHPHILLMVPEPLDAIQARQWRDVVNRMLPSGLPAEAEITSGGQPKTTPFYVRKNQGEWCYVVPLSRDPTEDEVRGVAVEWNREWPTGDFEIDYSSAGTAEMLRRDIETNGLREIALEAAKLGHNAWMKEMGDGGWSYGIKFDQANRRNPRMLPWDQLGADYRLHEVRRFDVLLEILQKMNLRLVRR